MHMARPKRNVASPIRVPKAAELVAAHLRRQIVRGELCEGDALAPEAELMRQFGVSRPTLREAVRILESESLISVTRGARGGARVHMPDVSVATRYIGLLLQTSATTLADVHLARTIIEPAAVRLLAEDVSEDAISLLRECIEEERAALGSPRAFGIQGARFHRLITEQTGNKSLALLAGVLHDVFEMHISSAAESAGMASTAQMRRGIRAQEKLLGLIAEGKAQEAEYFWRIHLEGVGRVLSKSYGAKTVVDLFE